MFDSCGLGGLFSSRNIVKYIGDGGIVVGGLFRLCIVLLIVSTNALSVSV